MQASELFQVPVVFVASYAHKTSFPGGTWVYVDPSRDAADFYLYQHAKPGDLAVTQDMGLASLLVKRDIVVLSPRGTILQDAQMDNILYNRHLSAELRRSGTYTKGPKAFSKEDRQRFFHVLQKILSKHEGIEESLKNINTTRRWSNGEQNS